MLEPRGTVQMAAADCPSSMRLRCRAHAREPWKANDLGSNMLNDM